MRLCLISRDFDQSVPPCSHPPCCCVCALRLPPAAHNLQRGILQLSHRGNGHDPVKTCWFTTCVATARIYTRGFGCTAVVFLVLAPHPESVTTGGEAIYTTSDLSLQIPLGHVRLPAEGRVTGDAAAPAAARPPPRGGGVVDVPF